MKVAILNLPLVTDGSTSLCPSLLVWPSFSLSRHLYGDSVYSVGTLTIYGKHYHTSTRDGAADAMQISEFFSRGQHIL